MEFYITTLSFGIAFPLSLISQRNPLEKYKYFSKGKFLSLEGKKGAKIKVFPAENDRWKTKMSPFAFIIDLTDLICMKIVCKHFPAKSPAIFLLSLLFFFVLPTIFPGFVCVRPFLVNKVNYMSWELRKMLIQLGNSCVIRKKNRVFLSEIEFRFREISSFFFLNFQFTRFLMNGPYFPRLFRGNSFGVRVKSSRQIKRSVTTINAAIRRSYRRKTPVCRHHNESTNIYISILE